MLETTQGQSYLETALFDVVMRRGVTFDAVVESADADVVDVAVLSGDGDDVCRWVYFK